MITGNSVEALSFSEVGVFRNARLENGEEIEASNCVSSIHPRQLLSLVDPSFFRPIYRKRIESLEETPSAFLVYGVLAKPVQSMKGRNHFFIDTLGYPVMGHDIPLHKRPLYVTSAGRTKDNFEGFLALSPSSFDELEQWKDTSSGKRPDAYRNYTEKVTRVFCDRLQELDSSFGAPIQVSCATPLTIRDWSNSPFGSMYGTKHMIDQHDLVPATRLKNLFLTGQSVSAPGLLGAMVSAFLTCGSIFGHHQMREELRLC